MKRGACVTVVLGRHRHLVRHYKSRRRAANPRPTPTKAVKLRRLEAIHHAQVWKATDIASMDLNTGPRAPLAFRATRDRQVQFRPASAQAVAARQKFSCAIASGDELKVRYGRNQRRGLRAGRGDTPIVGAGVFWSNRMYPVKVRMRRLSAGVRSTIGSRAARSEITTFEVRATIDVKVDGDTVETKPDRAGPGTSSIRLTENAGGAPQAQRDALTLLAVLMPALVQ
jgi:hypothetical protein